MLSWFVNAKMLNLAVLLNWVFIYVKFILFVVLLIDYFKCNLFYEQQKYVKYPTNENI